MGRVGGVQIFELGLLTPYFRSRQHSKKWKTRCGRLFARVKGMHYPYLYSPQPFPRPLYETPMMHLYSYDLISAPHPLVVYISALCNRTLFRINCGRRALVAPLNKLLDGIDRERSCRDQLACTDRRDHNIVDHVHTQVQ